MIWRTISFELIWGEIRALMMHPFIAQCTADAVMNFFFAGPKADQTRIFIGYGALRYKLQSRFVFLIFWQSITTMSWQTIEI